ncbi:MAG: alpha/beta hydrolase [Anaerolineae bacterium]|nr:alpha/beta hydrolase [Anaerolineae bacterium]
MAGKNRWGNLMAVAAGAATAAAVITYDRQRREIVARLQTDSQVAQTKAGPLEYAIAGEGPAVLAAHGILGGYDQSLAICRPLVDAGFKVIAVSRFGYLRTPPASNMSPEAQADQYAALLDELNIADVAMLGISGGGPSALQFALRHPNRCRALVMLSAVSRNDIPDPRESSPIVKLAINNMRFDFLVWLAITGVIKGMPILDTISSENQQQTEQNPASQEMMQAMLRSLFPISQRQVGIDTDLVQIPVMADLPLEKIDAPTLVMHGTADSVVPFVQGEHTAGKIPGARLIPIEGGEHLFPIAHYDQVWPEVIAFLKEKPTGKTVAEKPAKKAPAKKAPAKKTSTKKKAS